MSDIREEYNNGVVTAKSASNRWHALIVTNAVVAIGSRIHGHKSEFYVGNMRVRLNDDQITYPDMVICAGDPNFTDQYQDVLKNPTIIFEIVSSATDSTVKTQKLESYLAMESVKECFLIKQDEMRVEHYAKQNPKQWIYRIYNEREDVVNLDAVNCKISLQELYAQVKFQRMPLSSKAVN